MDFLSRLGASWQTVGVIVVSTVLVYLAVIALTRLAGPRSLAKMSSFDFAATVAIGSTVASTAQLTSDQGAWDDALLEGIRDGDLLRITR